MLVNSYNGKKIALLRPSDLAEKIAVVVSAAFDQFKINKGRRTETAMTTIGELGHSLEYQVSCKRTGYAKADDSEWLYDQLWYVNRADNVLIRVPMALEAEFSDKEPHIDGDFQKLLMARADVRVWLWHSLIGARKHIELYKQQIHDFDYSLPGDEWVFGAYDWTQQAVVVERFTVPARERP